MKYRLYIDESGNPDLEHADDPRYRFLGLTGIIMRLEYAASVAVPELEKIKKTYFSYHPDEPVVFHRKELVNKAPPFEALRNKETEKQFNEQLLAFFNTLEFVTLTVVIDKKMQRDLYKVWRYDPYHYCLAVTLERYIHFLEGENAKGDAMAESRGGKEDMRLKRSFEKLYIEGTDFVGADRFANSLTSRQLKVKPKANNIAGLQVADLIAHPSQRYALLQHKKIVDDREIFGDKIAEILVHSKYYRSKAGSIEGYGIKVLP
ncbi:MAG: DUF3800 domain-containing protein [Ignavibacteriales bacterium]|nr:DUF3800 domain-containing protein [Ignavibacteriales bacterium]